MVELILLVGIVCVVVGVVLACLPQRRRPVK
jgi:hypothetical protein